MEVFLETERMVLRQFTLDDVDNVLALDSDPEVRRFVKTENRSIEKRSQA